MISVNEAKLIIRKNLQLLPIRKLPLTATAGLMLAEDIYADTDIPSFSQSSMDGYAFSYDGWLQHKQLAIAGEVAAGSSTPVSIKSNEAVRIFTGAPVPDGADTVVMQEKVSIYENILIIEDAHLRKGGNVRDKGSEIRTGTLAMQKGQLLTPGAVGFLANNGVDVVTVYPGPAVVIIVTGNELQAPGKKLAFGQVYESNSVALTAALNSLRITEVTKLHAKDNLQTLVSIISESLEKNDLVLLTGGVSVGDYDFVSQAASQCGVVPLFHSVKQRPGKPLFFGIRDNKAVFGLPGNPSSVLTCFYEYVLPAVAQMMGRKETLQTIHVPLAQSFEKTVRFTFFLKGFYDGKTVTVLGAQESYRMRSFAEANCLIKIDEETMRYESGDLVEIHLLFNIQ